MSPLSKPVPREMCSPFFPFQQLPVVSMSMSFLINIIYLIPGISLFETHIEIPTTVATSQKTHVHHHDGGGDEAEPYA